MKYDVESDYPVTDSAAKAETGKTLKEWFLEIDGLDGLKKGRRAISTYLLERKIDPWWCTTISVEYEKHHNVRKKDGRFEGYFICSTKTITAPLQRVFDAWSNAQELNEWFGKKTEVDLRDDGGYSNGEGDRGIFLRVRQNKDIRMTFENAKLTAPTQVDVQFEDKGKGKTGLLVNHTRIQTRAEADGLRAAWADALDRLKLICER